MSRLEELINELCPDGVEYKKIKEICDISRGRVISKNYIRNNLGEYPVYSSQTENNGELGKISTFDYDGEYLTWTTDGANAGSVFYRNGRFSVTNVCGLLKVINNSILIKYLYYQLRVIAPNYVNSGMGNPKLMSNVMERIDVPVPPLPVQEEIVRILDNFTELTAELTARKQQYEYYRDYLLDFSDDEPKQPPQVEWKKLGYIATVKRGKRVVKNQLSNEFKYAVYQNSIVPLGYYTEYNRPSNSTFVISAGAAGQIGFSSEKFWAADDCLYFDCSKSILDKYIYYFLTSKQKYIDSKVRKASIPRLSKTVIENLLVPVPTLEEQKHIVELLEKFDKLCNDISDGLPSEIEARRKQYEYYRDKLLTFDNSCSQFVKVERERAITQ